MAEQKGTFQYMSEIAKSVIAMDATKALAACTSMHDLIVVQVPIPEPPYGVVVVRAPGSLHPPPRVGKC
jgi:hypothetical protein